MNVIVNDMKNMMPVCNAWYFSALQSTAEIIWQGKEEPLVFLDSLKEAHLFFLEGMTNGMNKTCSTFLF